MHTICFLLVQPTQHYWHAINPALPARYLLLRERYCAPIPYIILACNQPTQPYIPARYLLLRERYYAPYTL